MHATGRVESAPPRSGSPGRMSDLRRAARPVEDLCDLVGDARLVLLGEASHGTHEFYALRAELTRRLIARGGIGAVAVEADWPSAARVNRYVQRSGDDRDAEEALGDFVRFPRWMWRNGVIVKLVEWLREHRGGPGFCGLDLYSLRESMSAVVECLDTVDPQGAARASRPSRIHIASSRSRLPSHRTRLDPAKHRHRAVGPEPSRPGSGEFVTATRGT